MCSGDCVAMAERRQPILESDISGDRDLWFGTYAFGVVLCIPTVRERHTKTQTKQKLGQSGRVAVYVNHLSSSFTHCVTDGWVHLSLQIPKLA
jgi:hypothetical protein